MSVKYKITLGADPELVLLNSKTNQFESAHPYVQGRKDKPVKVPHGAIQLDGTGAEFNVHPAKNREEWVNNIRSVLGTLNKLIVQQNPDLVLSAFPTAEFDPTYFALLPDSVKERGCDPDFDAWRDGAPNEKPGGMEPVRTYGGHVHIGFTEHAATQGDAAVAHIYDCISMAKQMDVCLFIPSLLFDDDDRRRRQYGKPGAFRPQPHGCEYRPLSNVWVGDPELVGWVYDAACEGAYMLLAESDMFGSNHLWEHGAFWKEMEGITKGIYPLRRQLLNLHDELVGMGFPKLPERYLHA